MSNMNEILMFASVLTNICGGVFHGLALPTLANNHYQIELLILAYLRTKICCCPPLLKNHVDHNSLGLS